MNNPRRNLLKGAAWSVPTVVLATGAIPAYAASSVAPPTPNLDSPIYALWKTNPQKFGEPTNNEMPLSAVSSFQEFQNGIIIWDENSGAHFYSGAPGTFGFDTTGMLRDFSINMASNDVLVIGDSQVGNPWNTHRQWVGLGFTEQGYTPYFYSYHGIGIISPTIDHPSYFDAVVNNARALPVGSPGIIFVGGSGNDLSKNHDEILQSARIVITKLKELYPNSQIILSDLVGRRFVGHTARHILSEKLSTLAAQENILNLPSRYWISDFNLDEHMADFVHLTFKGHELLGHNFAQYLQYMKDSGILK